MRLVALDPGAETGYAVWDSGVMSWGQLGPEEHHYKLYAFLHANAEHLRSHQHPSTDMVVICERFDHVSGVARLISNEYVGVTRCWCQETGAALVLQSRSIKPGQDKKRGWATDEKLEACGMLIKPKTRMRHANDAMRHLMYFGFHNSRAPASFRAQILEGLKKLV